MRRLTLIASLLLALPVRAPGAPKEFRVETLLPSRPLCCSNGMALDGDLLYVNHAALDGIDAVDVNARTITPLASEDDADADEIVTPDDIWRDPVTGDLYVTEILTNGVRRLAPDGTRTRIMSGFGDGTAHPNAVTGLRRPGEPLRLFISMVQFEPGSRTGIWEIDPNGVLPPRLVYGAAGGQVVFGHGMRAPNAMQFDPDGAELYVPESYGGAVYAIDVDAHAARLVYQGRDEKANGIALRFARDGSILYAEQDSGRLLRLDAAGPPAQTPEVVAQLDPGIDGIAEHADGRIFLSNFRFGGVSEVLPNSQVRQLFRRSLDLPIGVAPLTDGRIAVGDLGSLAVVDPQAERDARLARPKQFIRDDFDIAIGVATTGGCDVYVTGFFRGTLQHVDVCDPTKPHTEVVARRTFAAPWDVAAGPPRELWVSDAAGTVWHLTGVSGPERATAVPLPTGFVNPTGIALGDGALYVAESGAGRVRIVDPATGVPLGVVDGLDEPEGLALEADGSLLVVEAGPGRLTRVRADGSRETLLTGLATDIRGVSVVPVLNFFADVAVTPAGEILVTGPADGSLTRLVPRE